MHNGISWAIVQRIMIDLPSYDADGKDKDDKVELNKENAGNIMNFINTM